MLLKMLPINTRTSFWWVAVIFWINFPLNPNAAWAVDCVDHTGIVFEREETCYSPKGGGGEVPVPFGVRSTAELADGEAYILSGILHLSPRKNGPYNSKVYLEVDLKAHSWLANAKRKQMPYYPIEGNAADWKQWDGQQIRLSCRAHGRIVRINDDLQYVMSLESFQPDPNVRDSVSGRSLGH